MDVKWIKIQTGIFNHEKIDLLEEMPEADMLISIWFKLLTMEDDDGIIYINYGKIYIDKIIPYDINLLSGIMKRPIELIFSALQIFEELKMIEISNKEN